MLFAALMFACASSPTGSATQAPSADTAEPAPSQVPDLTDWVVEAEGLWVGTADPTPVGAMPFALDFGWQDGGDLSATAANYGMSLTFRYHQDDAGWHLSEEGSLPGGFTQAHTLEPVLVRKGRVEWVTPEDPEYLRVVELHGDDAYTLEAWVRGELHAVISLAR